MNKGFFRESLFMVQRPGVASTLAKCGACKLHTTCKSPKMIPTGEGKRKILILAEAPGREEDEQGVQLVGNSGKELMDHLRHAGIEDMQEDCVLTSSLICHPPGNATPTEKQLGYCRPNLVKTLDDVKPRVIITLGGPAIKTLLHVAGQPDRFNSVTQWVGWTIPSQRLNAWICPTYHPSFLLRMKDPQATLMFRRHLKAAVKLNRKPWSSERPDNSIRMIMDPEEASDRIVHYTKRGGLAAFDYETNMTKPDSDKAEIVSCSICWRGKETIAFPWGSKIRNAMRYFLRSRKVRKIASNMKFEERWSMKEFGEGVRNWKFDTMLGAHVLDNRRNITSIKFQAFVLLGIDSYDDITDKFLKKTKSGSAVNNIYDLDMTQLLTYNALDSLYEYRVALVQMERLGMRDQGDHDFLPRQSA